MHTSVFGQLHFVCNAHYNYPLIGHSRSSTCNRKTGVVTIVVNVTYVAISYLLTKVN